MALKMASRDHYERLVACFDCPRSGCAAGEPSILEAQAVPWKPRAWGLWFFTCLEMQHEAMVSTPLVQFLVSFKEIWSSAVELRPFGAECTAS